MAAHDDMAFCHHRPLRRDRVERRRAYRVAARDRLSPQARGQWLIVHDLLRPFDPEAGKRCSTSPEHARRAAPRSLLAERKCLCWSGKCLCGVVRYAVEGPFLAGYCAARAAGLVPARVQRLCRDRAGQAARHGRRGHIALFEQNPDNIVSFCKLCGASPFALVRDGQFFHVALGTLVDDPGILPMFHIFVGSKAPWHEITDALPQRRGFPRGGPGDLTPGRRVGIDTRRQRWPYK